MKRIVSAIMLIVVCASVHGIGADRNGEDMNDPRGKMIPWEEGAWETGRYRNVFREAGYEQEDIDAKLAQAYYDLFEGPNRVYFEVGDDMAYVSDLKNRDARTEGLSYGLMVAVQLNKKDVFDRLWRWTKKYMQHQRGPRDGYFAWSVDPKTGRHNSEGTASDGELYFVTDLLFASNRWGDDTGIDYYAEARRILDAMWSKDGSEGINNIINVEHQQISFVPESDRYHLTDPSYHVPAFFEIWAAYARDGHEQFYRECADTARAFLHKVCHPETGLNPDYAEYSGEPPSGRRAMRAAFRFDSWRVPMNIAMDYSWYAKDKQWQQDYGRRFQGFLLSRGIDTFEDQFNVDGTLPEWILPAGGYRKLRHSLGLVATSAAASLMGTQAKSWRFVDAVWNAKLEPYEDGYFDPYYDGFLYLFSLMHLSGNYRIIKPAAPVIGKSLRYCNPLPIDASSQDGSPRGVSLGDVTVVKEGNQYYMFCTGGSAWVSPDLVNWKHRPVQGRVPVAPGVVKYNGYFYLSGNGAPLYRARDILGPYESVGDWKDHDGRPWTGTANNGRTWEGAFDVHFFIDDGKPYLYYPGRGAEGIYVVPLDPDDLTRFAAAPKRLFGFDKSHTWERYGEMNEYSEITWIEGPWMIKHGDTYYLEYSASGTQWLSYATGVYTSKSPLGPFAYAPKNPILRQTTGVVTGPGHGCVVQGPDGNFWQFYTIVLANPPGGRRIGMDPVGFDEKGNLFVRGPSETPQWAPGVVDDPARHGDSGSLPLTVNKLRAMNARSGFSSQRAGHEAPYAIDNSNGTWWEPAEDDEQPSLTVDLGPATEFDPVQQFTIDSCRIEFVAGRGRFGFGAGGGRGTAQPADGTVAHRYKIEASVDGDAYTTVLDRTGNNVTRYVEFEEIPPTACRFVRLTVTDWPRRANSNLGIMEFTIFGKPIEP